MERIAGTEAGATHSTGTEAGATRADATGCSPTGTVVTLRLPMAPYGLRPTPGMTDARPELMMAGH